VSSSRAWTEAVGVRGECVATQSPALLHSACEVSDFFHLQLYRWRLRSADFNVTLHCSVVSFEADCTFDHNPSTFALLFSKLKILATNCVLYAATVSGSFNFLIYRTSFYYLHFLCFLALTGSTTNGLIQCLLPGKICNLGFGIPCTNEHAVWSCTRVGWSLVPSFSCFTVNVHDIINGDSWVTATSLCWRHTNLWL